MKILITGGSGYIGQAAARAFVAGGHTVTLYDPEIPRDAPGAAHVPGKLAEHNKLTTALLHVDVVVHMAAIATVGEGSISDFWQNNIAGTWELTRCMMTAGCRRLVFASSCAVYGNPLLVPTPEVSSLAPCSVYGVTKAMNEMMFSELCRTELFNVTALRFFNVAGAVGRHMERREKETHLIPLALRACMHGTTLRLNGDDFATPDGTCVRDYVHVADVARAVMTAAEPRRGWSVFNVGTGCGVSNMEIINLCEEITGRSIDLDFGPRRPGDPSRIVADSEESRHVLGWRPEQDIRSIISSTWEAMQ